MEKSKSNFDELFNKYRDLSSAAKEAREVYAVAVGAPVSFSTFWHNAEYICVHYQLDHLIGSANAWSSKTSKLGEWIQVSHEFPKLWTGVILQGRADYDQWVKSVKFSYSLNGKTWFNVDDGKTFQANSDRN